VLPAGAGAASLRKARNKRVEPANVAAAIVAIILLIYYVGWR